MSRLDETIADVSYILDILRAYSNIVQSGNCSSCYNRACEWKPEWGEPLRWNCPHYEQRK